jgi:hypothetical protein
MISPLLVVGIDPGTTVGYSVLDIQGNALLTGSTKHLGLASLIGLIIRYGTPVLVATDKASPPGFVSSFATKVGARLVHPEADLQVDEKRDLARSYPTRNDHERDALSSALFSLSRFRPLIVKVADFASERHLEDYHDRILYNVLKHERMSVHHAYELVRESEAAHDPEPSVEVRTPPPPRSKEADRILRLQKELDLVMKERDRWKRDAERLHDRCRDIAKRTDVLLADHKAKSRLANKEKRIRSLDRAVEQERAQIKALEDEIQVLEGFLVSLDRNILIKKLRTLGQEDFERVRSALRIGEKDVLLVDDASVVGGKVVDFLEGKGITILYKERVSSNLRGIVTVKAAELDIHEGRRFATVDGHALAAAVKKHDVVGRILKEYRDKRVSP